MDDREPKAHALIRAPERTPAKVGNLAHRTLVDSGLGKPRQLIVDAGGSTMFRTIGEGLEAARNGDKILVRPGEYKEHLVIAKSVWIAGDGPRELIRLSPPTFDTPCIVVDRGAPHLSEITVDGSMFSRGADEDEYDSLAELLLVRGGSRALEDMAFVGGAGVRFSGYGQGSALVGCTLVEAKVGVYVEAGGSLRIADNSFSACAQDAIWIAGRGADPLVFQNSISDGSGDGIFICAGAEPRIEDNEIWGVVGSGIAIADEGCAVVVANRVHDNGTSGILVEGASPLVEENDIWANGDAGIQVIGLHANPTIRRNRVHDGQTSGIGIAEGNSPVVEENDVWGNADAGIWAGGAGTRPAIRANRVFDGGGDGILALNGASPNIADNDVWGNSGVGISAEGLVTSPIIRANRVRDARGAGIGVAEGASPQVLDNEIWGNTGAGIWIGDDVGVSNALVRGNRIHHGAGPGIAVVDGAEPRIEANEVWRNAVGGVRVMGVGTSPVIARNNIRDNDGGGVCVLEGSSPAIYHNVFRANLGTPVLVDADATPIVGWNDIRD